VIASAASFGIQDCNCFWIGHTIAMMNRAAASGCEHAGWPEPAAAADQHAGDNSCGGL
jgi:hypothetical protein